MDLDELFKTKEGRDILRLDEAKNFYEIMHHLDELDRAEIEAEMIKKDQKKHN